MRTVETFKEESRSALRAAAAAMIDDIFPGGDMGDMDDFADIRQKLGVLKERMVAEFIEAVTGICADVYAIPTDVLRVHCHLEEDGVQSKGPNVVAKITAYRNDANWITFGRMAGKSVELVCLEDAVATPAPEKPAVELDPQGELPGIDATLVYSGEDDSEADPESEPEPEPLTAERMIGLLWGPDKNAEDAHNALIDCYERVEAYEGENFADALGEKQALFIKYQERNDNPTVLQALAMQLEDGEIAEDSLAWLCAAAYSLCVRDYDGEDPAGASHKEKVCWAINEYRPFLAPFPLSALEAHLSEKHRTEQMIPHTARGFVQLYDECAAQMFSDFNDVIEDEATVLRNEMNRMPCGVVAAMVPAAKKQRYTEDCRWVIVAAVALAHRMFNGTNMLDSMTKALEAYVRVCGTKTKKRGQKTAPAAAAV